MMTMMSTTTKKRRRNFFSLASNLYISPASRDFKIIIHSVTSEVKKNLQQREEVELLMVRKENKVDCEISKSLLCKSG
jgi:hypothetical protein